MPNDSARPARDHDPASVSSSTRRAGTRLDARLGDDAILRWVLFVAAIGFAAVVLWDYGYLAYLLTYDTSHISLIIIALFLLFSVDCLAALIAGTRELAAVEAATMAFEDGGTLAPAGSEGARIGGLSVGRGLLVGEFLHDAAIKRRNDAAGPLDTLLDSFAAALRVPRRRGVFVADVMYKLGMLGTVLGFVAMLVSLRDLGDFELEAMRDALQQMTGGMAVALLTTITGLICGVLLRIEFNILDALSLRVLRRTVRLAELYLKRADAGQSDV